MFKAGTVAGITSTQSLVHDTQKGLNKEGTIDHKERNSIARSARKLNGAHHRVIPPPPVFRPDWETRARLASM
jgi:hypothetical protein